MTPSTNSQWATGVNKQLASEADRDGWGVHESYYRLQYLTRKTCCEYGLGSQESEVEPRRCAGCFFFFDLSPIKVRLTEEKLSFASFLTSACAIIGGVFTVSGLIDSFVYHGSQVPAPPSPLHGTPPEPYRTWPPMQPAQSQSQPISTKRPYLMVSVRSWQAKESLPRFTHPSCQFRQAMALGSPFRPAHSGSGQCDVGTWRLAFRCHQVVTLSCRQ